MQKLKPFFITPYLVAIVVIAAMSVFEFIQQPALLPWFVTLISSLAACLYFVYLYTRYPRDVQITLLIVTVISVLAPIICIAHFKTYPESPLLPFYLSLACLAGWLFYDRWYSKMPTPEPFTSLGGSAMPSLTLKDVSGKEQLVDFKNGRYHILFFHRGSWCPFCVAQVREARELAERVLSEDALVHMISGVASSYADPSDSPISKANRYWTDEDNKASSELGISHHRGVPFGLEVLGYESDTTLPASIVVDPNGVVIYNEVNADYRKRESLEFYLRIVKGHKLGEKVLGQQTKS